MQQLLLHRDNATPVRRPPAISDGTGRRDNEKLGLRGARSGQGTLVSMLDEPVILQDCEE